MGWVVSERWRASAKPTSLGLEQMQFGIHTAMWCAVDGADLAAATAANQL